MPCNCLACFVLQVLSVPVTRVRSIPEDICAHGSASRHWEVWWDTGIVLTIKRRAKVLVKEAVPSQHFPPAVVALSLHVVCHTVPGLGIEHHQPSRDPTAGQNGFLH